MSDKLDTYYALRFSTIRNIAKAFPKTTSNAALTGWIPIDIFNKIEHIVRPIMRREGVKAIYRGPRVSNGGHGRSRPSMTRRCDATHAVLYSK